MKAARHPADRTSLFEAFEPRNHAPLISIYVHLRTFFVSVHSHAMSAFSAIVE